MPSKLIPFAEWTPDEPNALRSNLVVAENVIPAEKAYRPWPTFCADERTAVGALDAFTAFAANGQHRIIVGFPDRLEDWQGANLGSGYSATEWSFDQWGTETLATNTTDGLQVAEIDGTFATATEAPKARYVAQMGEFVILAGTEDNPYRYFNSGINDRTSWAFDPVTGDTPFDPLTQADVADMPREYGAITGITGGDYATIFQERGISRVVYTGGQSIFRVDTFEEEKGCIAPKSIVTYGHRDYFISQDGPNIWNGQSAVPVANGKYRRWFMHNFDHADAVDVRGVLDRRNNCVIWYWKDCGLLYSFEENRATFIRFKATMDVIINAPANQWCGDAEAYEWGDVNEALFGLADGAYGAFVGPNSEATIETGGFEISPQSRAFLTELWPIVDSAGGIYGSIGSRDQRLGDCLELSKEAMQTPSGMIPVRASGRAYRVRLRIPEGVCWRHAQGVEVTYNRAGRK